jgi:outer membrane receptor protein involved in Fe transport
MEVEQDLRRPIVLALAIAALSTAARADDAIVVTGRALEQAPGAAAYSVQVIDAERLRAGGRLEAVLEDVAGFQLFRRSDSRAANPTSQGATLRGIGGNASSRALVLLDGVPVADPFAGWIPWPAIRAASLAEARVTTGGGSGAFGAGALAGVIELASAGGERPPSLAAAYGSRDSLAVSGGGAVRLGRGFVAFDAGIERGDGYRLLPKAQRGPVDIAADYRQYGGSVRLVAPLGEGTELQVRAAAFDDTRTRGIAIVDSANSGADASVRLVGRGTLPWEALAYVQARDFAARFARLDAARATAIPTLDQFAVPATGIGAKAEARPTLGAHRLRIGADWRHASGETRERFQFAAGAFTRLREAGGRSHVYGVYIEDDWQIDERLLLTAGARLDRWQLDEGRLDERTLAGAVLTATGFADRAGTEPTARIGAAFEAAPALTLRAAGYLGFRVPTLNELYRPFRVGADATAANAALVPERLRGVEAGIDYRPLANATASLTLFRNRLENAIGNVTLGRGPGVFPGVGFVAGAYRQRLNLDAIEAWGVEASARATLGRWRLAASYAFSDSSVEASGPAAALDGRRPAQSPRHQASGSIRYDGGGWRAGVDARHDGARSDDDLERLRLASAFTVDASAEVAIGGGLSVRLAAENLFNETVVAGLTDDGIVDRGQPRTLWFGIGWTR